jgi:hypothetical protein
VAAPPVARYGAAPELPPAPAPEPESHEPQ